MLLTAAVINAAGWWTRDKPKFTLEQLLRWLDTTTPETDLVTLVTNLESLIFMKESPKTSPLVLRDLMIRNMSDIHGAVEKAGRRERVKGWIMRRVDSFLSKPEWKMVREQLGIAS